MTANEQIPQPRWFERVWAGLVGSFLVCVAAAGLSTFLRYTLAESLFRRIEFSFYSGFIFGGVAFVFLVGPIQGVLLLLLRWFRA